MNQNTYDFIIVGSGPAGAVMARTLSDGGHSVLLLEAGQNADGDALIRSANSNLYAHFPEYFWPGQSVPQTNAKNKPFNLTGGRVSGGGSSVNGEMYVRPTPFVLKEWEKIGGAQWSPESALRRFRELERFHGSGDPAVHGTQGRLHIRRAFEKPPLLADKLAAAIEKASGCPAIEDFNDPKTPVGPFRNWQLYQKENGDRASASVCFLAQESKTLTVKYESTAVQILFNEKKEAEGVRYLAGGREEIARAGERVIVSAGIYSVQLLMLSGIGPEDALKEAGVPVLAANPHVGAGLAGDAYLSVAMTVNEKDVQELAKADPNGKFPGGAFLPAPQAGARKDERSIQIIPTQFFGQTMYMSVLCVNPKSRGSLKIQSRDPFKIMLGDFGFLSDPADMEMLKDTARNYIAGIGSALTAQDAAYRLAAPGPDILRDDARLEDYIRSSFIHTYHDQCALKMGGAVDGWGEAYGVKKLTVADASIIPCHVDGNTSAAAYLIGYTIARHLLGEA